MKTVIELTREAGGFDATPKFLERFAELVRADERERIYFQTSSDFVKAAVAEEREACAKVCDWYVDYSSNPMNFAENCAQEIRARGKKS